MNIEISKASPLFEKRTVSELSENELLGIDGGGTPLTFTMAVVVVGAGIGIAAAGYQFGQWLHDKLN
jgi:lactobin A/cerein 7B family class IIb bacteriocin